MDLHALSKQGKVSLLTLPRTEFKATQNDNHNAAASTVPPLPPVASNDDTAPLLLLQLPKGWTTQDLKDSKFIGSGADSSQVVLVVESKQTSFSINRLETSNCLVLVPPPQYDANEQGPPSKKSKLTAAGKTILPVPARLLTPGGMGSSFLELREKPLLIHALTKSLQEHVLNPYNIHINPYNTSKDSDNSNSHHIKNSSVALCKGRTVYDLAVHLQSSQAQVVFGLEAIQAFRLPSRTTTHTDAPVAYCLLAEETVLVACNAIVSALAEADDCQDYALAGVSVKRLVEHVIQNMSAEESYVDAEFVVRHCLSTLSAAAKDVDGEDNIRLSVGKVRIRIRIRMDSQNLRIRDCVVASAQPRHPVLTLRCFLSFLFFACSLMNTGGSLRRSSTLSKTNGAVGRDALFVTLAVGTARCRPCLPGIVRHVAGSCR
jgi:hypothetical protein